MISDDQRLKLLSYVNKSSKEALYHSMAYFCDEIELLREDVRRLKMQNVVCKTVIDDLSANLKKLQGILNHEN